MYIRSFFYFYMCILYFSLVSNSINSHLDDDINKPQHSYSLLIKMKWKIDEFLNLCGEGEKKPKVNQKPYRNHIQYFSSNINSFSKYYVFACNFRILKFSTYKIQTEVHKMQFIYYLSKLLFSFSCLFAQKYDMHVLLGIDSAPNSNCLQIFSSSSSLFWIS